MRHGTSGSMPLRPLAAIVAALFAGSVAAAGIVPDGKTAITVATGADGKAIVNIAAPVAGVSHNTYSDFNVGRPGADLINTGVNARTIVNEVTSTNPSLIEGPVTVVGPRANLIIANPNGITVNGGSFINTGTLALSTGKVSFYDFQPAPGFTQRNVVLDTSIGQIEIGPGGLSGAFNSLELIAKTLKVSGKIENTFTNANAGIRAVIGASRAEFDTSVSPTDGLSQFVIYSTPSSSNAGAIAIDITPLGSLTAGRIQLIVTDQGAGVRHAGSAFANVGDFVVSASGDLRIDGGRIEAVRDIVLDTPRTIAISRDDSANAFIAGRNIEFRSKDVTLAGGTVAAGTDAQRGDITFGIPGETATGAMTFAGVESADSYTPLTMTASGGIGVFAQGQAVAVDGARLVAQQNLLIDAKSLTLGTQADNTVSPKAVPGSLVSHTGEVKLSVAGDIVSNGGLVDGVAGVTVNSVNLSLSSASIGAELSKSRFTSEGGSISITTTGDVKLHASDLVAAGDVNVKAVNVTFEHDASGTGSTIAAVGGAVIVDVSGDLINRGSLIQGEKRSDTYAASRGAVTLNVGGNFLNESPDDKTLAAVFGNKDDVVIAVQGNVTNHAARIVSNKALTIEAGGDVVNLVDKVAGSNGEQRVDHHASRTELLFFTRSRNGFDIDYGSLPMPNQLAYLVADGDIIVKGRNITNRGGEIDSNAGSIYFTAKDQFLNEALASGQVHFERKCLIVCKTHAESNVAATGGLISTAHNLSINAGSEAINIGGRVLALDDMTITAPKVTAKGITGYSVLSRDRGMKAWFGDTWAQIYAMDVGGSFTASRGKLTINGALYEDGGSAVGAAGTEVSGGIVVIRPAQREPVTIASHLGLSTWLGR